MAFLSPFPTRIYPLPLHPSGRAMLPARTAGPGSVLLLGSRRVSGDRYPVKSGMTGLLQSVCYGFLCPLRHSKVSFELLKGFRVTPETTLPLAGRGFLSEVGKPVFLPAVRLPEAALRP